MEKLLTVVLVTSLLLLATLADHASSRSSTHSSLDAQQGESRKGIEELAYPHYRREGDDKEQKQVAAMEVKRNAAREGGWKKKDEDAADATEGLVSSEDYSGVSMHDHSSPPAHKKHPKP